jgi:copper homeostasis protein
MSTHIEICINCDTVQQTTANVAAAYAGGATTIELCRDMRYDGLTPKHDSIVAARDLFLLPGLLVMIRPRAGDFAFNDGEIIVMQQQIVGAANAGADGVVLGILQSGDNRIAINKMEQLIETAKKHNLSVSFHRAFDATPEPFAAIDVLIALGVDRVLTSGTAWGAEGGAVAGIGRINALHRHVADKIEIVIGGGVSVTNIAFLKANLSPVAGICSFHAYSSVLNNGIVSAEKVSALANAANHMPPTSG